MGKGARNRAKRKQTGQDTQAAGLTEALLEELFAVEDSAGFEELLARRPELMEPQVEDELRILATNDGYGTPFGHFADLLSGARTNLNDAWATYSRARAHVDELVHQLEGVQDTIRAAGDRRDFDEVVALTEEALPQSQRGRSRDAGGLPPRAARFGAPE